ncbi:MAG TPA: asparagine synthase (glutamine-hydrolyzing) [Gammaproteobacteria bacterium]|nr:asparagine synthase (glutamine-hydrolyzing) [Gammaproteobacteria bacterium]
MCGVAFLLAPELSLDERRERLKAAVRSLRHRGPDASNVLEGPASAVGHTRLAIVDLAGGQQPLRDPTQRWTLAFNGEIYNFAALRRELSGRWQFRDSSDTEVLLAGLVLEGSRFVARLDGMWAFALHDAMSGDVLLSRDRFGKKPLYYCATGSAFACASELPALAALLPEAGRSEDPAAIGDYFRFGYTLPGATCLAGIREVLPAHTLTRRADGALSSQRYWSPSLEPWRGSFDQAADEVRERLAAAVKSRQVAADVEVGAFLSGGVDSTVVCALAQRSGLGRLRTFTAGFAEPTYDERQPAARAAGELATLHLDEELSPELASSLAASLPERLGQPFGDASLVPTALVARLAARHVKVVLTGDGGDEVFGGYARYAGRLLRQHYRRLPAALRSLVEGIVLRSPEPIAHHSGSLRKRAHLFVALAREKDHSYLAPPAIRAEVLARLAPALPPPSSAPEVPWPSDPDELRHMMLMDWVVWLPQDILAKVDRATMAYSLEARSPFLDRELVEFVIRLPWRWHFAGYRGKRLLRAAMRGHVPDFVWARRKQGFASPVAHWMRASLGEELLALTAGGDTGAVDGVAVRALLQEHRAGSVDHSQPLWLAYAYLRWRSPSQRAA